MSLRAAFALYAFISATPAAAQSTLSPDQFLDQAEGHTLTFNNYSSGRIVGVEQFLSRTRSVWARQDGTCTYGRIEVQGAQVCFHYEDTPGEVHCWLPYVLSGDMLVISPQQDIQRISQISNEPVVCRDVPIS